jgi:hypothetical protein
MRDNPTIFAVFGLCAALAAPSAAFSADKTADNPNGCKVVERKGGSAPSGSVSSSVTAGGGHVSAFTSGGNGVSVYSGGSNGGGSMATAGTTSDGHSTTMVTNSNGDCTIYVDPGKSREH